MCVEDKAVAVMDTPVLMVVLATMVLVGRMRIPLVMVGRRTVVVVSVEELAMVMVRVQALMIAMQNTSTTTTTTAAAAATATTPAARETNQTNTPIRRTGERKVVVPVPMGATGL